MKIRVNQRLNEQDTIADVVDKFDKEIASEVADAAKELKPEGGKVVLEINDEPWAEAGGTDIEEALDDCLAEAREIQRKIARAERSGQVEGLRFLKGFANNLLIIGPAGTGKTSRIEQWCDANNIVLVEKDAKTMDPSDLGGIISRQIDDAGKMTNKATKLTNSEFDVLDTPDTVLFLDELNRATQDVAGSLLTLIQSHKVVDHKQEKGTRVLKGFLFTVAAINPAVPDAADVYTTQNLDMAMKTRFRSKDVENNNMEHLEYLRQKYKYQVELPAWTEEEKEDALKDYRRYHIAKALLTDPRFEFDTLEEEKELKLDNQKSLNYRTFDNLLQGTDGTVRQLLDRWPEFVNPHKQRMAEQILDDYIDFDWDDLDDEGFEDIDDEANAIFNERGGLEGESAIDKLMKEFG